MNRALIIYCYSNRGLNRETVSFPNRIFLQYFTLYSSVWKANNQSAIGFRPPARILHHKPKSILYCVVSGSRAGLQRVDRVIRGAQKVIILSFKTEYTALCYVISHERDKTDGKNKYSTVDGGQRWFFLFFIFRVKLYDN